MKRKNEYQMYVPRQFVRNDFEMEAELKRGILISFCYIRRFSSPDGIFSGRLYDIMDDLGLHYDSTKTSKLPKRINTFIEGLDFLINTGYIKILRGDYRNLNERFILQINYIDCKKGFILLNYANFDYILKIKKRLDKAGLLETLLFVCSCYNYIDYGYSKNSFTVCSYSLDTMAKFMNVTRTTIYNYLTNLSVNEGYEGDNDAPLIKSKKWHIVIGERIIRFPNIYVENVEGATDKIEFQKKYIKKKFDDKIDDNDEDLEILFQNLNRDDEIDDLY